MRTITLLSAGLFAAYYYATSLTLVVVQAGYDVYTAVLNGATLAPYRYRILTPTVLQPFIEDERAFTSAVIVFHILAFPLLLFVQYTWFRRFASNDRALAVTIWGVLYLPMMFTSAWGTVSTWSTVEILLFPLALLSLNHPRRIILILCLATLNRPTSAVFIPMLYILYHGRSHWKETLLMGFIWGGVYGAIILMQGQSGHIFGNDWIVTTWQHNTTTWRFNEAIINNAFLIPLWVAAALGYKRSPPHLRHMAWALLPYMAVLFIASQWYETRLQLTMFPILGALWLHADYRQSSR